MTIKNHPYIFQELKGIAVRKYWILQKMQPSENKTELWKSKNMIAEMKNRAFGSIENLQEKEHTKIK